MAFANNINRDMTAADARAVAGQTSWSDIYPDDFDYDADVWEYLGDHRLYFDTNGEPHFVPGKNPFSSEVARDLEAGEKDGLLARKAGGGLEGAIRDTRGRYGEPKQWDHVVVGLSRAEAEALGPEGIKDWFRVAIRAMQDSPAGDGKRQMLVTPIHDDTDNVHIQFLLHRIPVNESARTVGASYELSRNSEAAEQMKQVNVALEAAGLPMISDFRMGAYAVNEPRAASTEELARGAERIKDAGGITPPDMTTGPLPTQRERVSPEMRHLDSLLADAVKRQKEAEAIATSAATAVAAAQHARAALDQYEAEVKAREAVEADLEATNAVLAETSAKLTTTTRDLESANSAIEELTTERDALTRTVAERDDTIVARDRQIDELRDLHTTEMEDAAERLAAVEASRDQWQASFTAMEEDLKAEQGRHQEDNASAAAEIEKLRAELIATKQAATAELDKVRAELVTARTDADKADQLRALAESQLETERVKTEAIQSRFDSYRTQISTLEEVDGQPVAGDGIEVIGLDRRKAIANVEFPADAKVGRRFFGRQRFDWEDGTSVLTTRQSAKLTAGNLTPSAVATMIAHAQREGWSPITVAAHTPAVQKAITEAARSVGLILDGEEPAASIALAAPTNARRRSPSWATKAPASWSQQERTAAQRYLDSQKVEGKVDQALPLDAYGQRVFEQYQRRQEASDSAAGAKPQEPK